MKTRREFLLMAGGAAVAPRTILGAQVPGMLDHVLLGCSDLEHAIAFVEERTGARAAFGGVHPGRGTQNALLSLGERRYLEIIALDPNQASESDPIAAHIAKLVEPRLVTWAAHTGSAAALAQRLAKENVVAKGPTPGSRKRPDGNELHWSTLNLQNNLNGLLPFFIEWGADSIHPSLDAPRGCDLVRFGAESPKPEILKAKFRAIGIIDISVEEGEKEALRARISGPKGMLEVTS